jgi:hypothetical protein
VPRVQAADQKTRTVADRVASRSSTPGAHQRFAPTAGGVPWAVGVSRRLLRAACRLPIVFRPPPTAGTKRPALQSPDGAS